jgi:thioredoxin 1
MQHQEPIMAISQTSDTDFEQDVLKASKPVIVDFWAEWCGPCKMIAPFLEDLASELGEQVQVVKVNIDDNPLTPTRYGVKGIPTLMVFKNGEVAATKVGALPKTKLIEWVKESL